VKASVRFFKPNHIAKFSRFSATDNNPIPIANLHLVANFLVASWLQARGTSNGMTVRIVALDGSRERRYGLQVLLKMMLWVLKALRVIDNNLGDIVEEIDLAQNDMTLGIEKV
jgi:hypothetical protein